MLRTSVQQFMLCYLSRLILIWIKLRHVCSLIFILKTAVIYSCDIYKQTLIWWQQIRNWDFCSNCYNVLCLPPFRLCKIILIDGTRKRLFVNVFALNGLHQFTGFIIRCIHYYIRLHQSIYKARESAGGNYIDMCNIFYWFITLPWYFSVCWFVFTTKQ